MASGAFFDRNPEAFAAILEFLRTEKIFLRPDLSMEQLAIEADFYELEELKKALQVEERPAEA